VGVLPALEQSDKNDLENMKRREGDLEYGSNSNYLEINSAAKFHEKRVDNNIKKIKNTLNEIE
jgi:hypothetical protein